MSNILTHADVDVHYWAMTNPMSTSVMTHLHEEPVKVVLTAGRTEIGDMITLHFGADVTVFIPAERAEEIAGLIGVAAIQAAAVRNTRTVKILEA